VGFDRALVEAAEFCDLGGGGSFGSEGSLDDALDGMTVMEIWTDRDVLEDGVDEQAGSDRVSTEGAERLISVGAVKVAVRHRELLGCGLSAPDADDL
jgi:hypothetical protein